MRKFEETCFTYDRPRLVRLSVLIESFAEVHETIRDVPLVRAHKILHSVLYSFQRVNMLQANNKQQRIGFENVFLIQYDENNCWNLPKDNDNFFQPLRQRKTPALPPIFRRTPILRIRSKKENYAEKEIANSIYFQVSLEHCKTF